jgi:hypothetical protein
MIADPAVKDPERRKGKLFRRRFRYVIEDSKLTG